MDLLKEASARRPAWLIKKKYSWGWQRDDYKKRTTKNNKRTILKSLFDQWRAGRKGPVGWNHWFGEKRYQWVWNIVLQENWWIYNRKRDQKERNVDAVDSLDKCYGPSFKAGKYLIYCLTNSYNLEQMDCPDIIVANFDLSCLLLQARLSQLNSLRNCIIPIGASRLRWYSK